MKPSTEDTPTRELIAPHAFHYLPQDEVPDFNAIPCAGCGEVSDHGAHFRSQR